MKQLLVFLALMACLTGAWAQDTAPVTGVVTDGHGVPIPGAKVCDCKGDAATTTDMKGRFVLESDRDIKKVTALYPGYVARTRRAGNDMTIRLRPLNWWTTPPDRYRWFVGVTAGTPMMTLRTFSRPKSLDYGIRVGVLKEWGYYVNASMSFFNHDDGPLTTSNPMVDEQYYANGAKADFKTMRLGLGAIRRLGCPIHLYLGVGYVGSRAVYECISSADGSTSYRNACSVGSVYGDLGLMLRMNRFMVSAGLTAHPAMKPNVEYGNPELEEQLFVPDSRLMRTMGVQFGVHYIF